MIDYRHGFTRLALVAQAALLVLTGCAHAKDERPVPGGDPTELTYKVIPARVCAEVFEARTTIATVSRAGRPDEIWLCEPKSIEPVKYPLPVKTIRGQTQITAIETNPTCMIISGAGWNTIVCW